MGVVSPDVKKELLSLKKDDLTVSFIISKISRRTETRFDESGKRIGFEVHEPEWNCQDTMKLKAGECTNTTDIDTTLGSVLFNKLCIEGKIDTVIPGGFFNDVLTGGTLGKIVKKYVSIALMDKKISLMPNVTEFIQAFEFYGLMLSSALCASFTPGILSVNQEMRQYRDKLYAEAGENPTVQQTVEIEEKVIEFAKKLLEGDPGMALFNSGARGSFDDNYKMMSLTVGAVQNPANGKYDVIKSNYIDGIEKSELPALGNSIVNGAYPKAVGTAEGGYITKQFYSVFQGIQLDAPGTDCGSKGYLAVFLTIDNYNDYIWQYIVDGNKLVMLDSDNMNQYTNKVVLLRSPIGCLGQKFCNICMGERYYKLSITNAGLTAGRLPNAILNAGMKAFHQTKVKLYSVDVDKLIIS